MKHPVAAELGGFPEHEPQIRNICEDTQQEVSFGTRKFFAGFGVGI